MVSSFTNDPFSPINFLALPPDLSDPAKSLFTVLPVPYDSTTTYKSGAREGPRALIEASRQMEDFDIELGFEPSAYGIHTLPELEPHAGGPEAMIQRVSRVVTQIANRDQFLVTIGGEHSISVGVVEALHRLYPDLSVLFLDAHADMRLEYQGTKYSHACTGRRINEICKTILVGTRSMSSEEREFIQERALPSFSPTQAFMDGISPYPGIVDALTDHVYISVDLDVIDPSIMAAVGTPEPGGLSWTQILSIIRQTISQRKIVGFDLMELSPSEGPTSSTFTAARLAYKIMGYLAPGFHDKTSVTGIT